MSTCPSSLALGNFNAGNGDGVRVLGLNGDWTTGVTMAPSAANTNIYTATNDLTAGTYPNYLFVITPASGSWSWETTAAGGNRWFLVPAGGSTNLPVVYFSDNTNLPAGSVSVTFEVNLTSAIELGNFTIGSDYVNVFGSFDNWSTTGVRLTNVPGTRTTWHAHHLRPVLRAPPSPTNTPSMAAAAPGRAASAPAGRKPPFGHHSDQSCR